MNTNSNRNDTASIDSNRNSPLLDLSYNQDFNSVFVNMESGFASVKIATAAVVDILKQEQEENEEELLRCKEQDLLLAISVRETEILDSIPFESITRLMTEAALRTRIVQEEIFF